MTNVAYPSIDDYNDVETLGSWNEALKRGEDMDAYLKLVHRQSRDNARTPIQWNTKKNAGFSDVEPWLKVNPNYVDINVESQEQDQNSILNLYRKMIAYRKTNDVLVYGDYECIDEANENLYIYRRWNSEQSYVILLNFSDSFQTVKYNDLNLESTEMVISNYLESHSATQLRPWEAQLRKY